jgi:hypothetical protein
MLETRDRARGKRHEKV